MLHVYNAYNAYAFYMSNLYIIHRMYIVGNYRRYQ